MSMSFFFTKVIELLLRDFQNDGGADVCGGPSPACYITLEQYASDNRVGAVNGTCGTCDTDAGCRSYMQSLMYDTWCSPGEVLYLSRLPTYCAGCDTPNVTSTPSYPLPSRLIKPSLFVLPTTQAPDHGPVCSAPDNSYATCSESNLGSNAYCSFVCKPSYKISPDGTGCVLIHVEPVAESILYIASTTYTTASCVNSGDTLVSGTYSYDGVDVCGCVPNDGGTSVCEGATASCNSTTMLYVGQPPPDTIYYEGQPVVNTASCTTCDP